MFTLLYDDEYLAEFETLEEAMEFIADEYKEYQEWKIKEPDLSEDIEFLFEPYKIVSVVLEGSDIEERVKNSC